MGYLALNFARKFSLFFIVLMIPIYHFGWLQHDTFVSFAVLAVTWALLDISSYLGGCLLFSTHLASPKTIKVLATISYVNRIVRKPLAYLIVFFLFYRLGNYLLH